MPDDGDRTFRELIGGRDIVVCVGSGGVGKTTTSAVIGLHEAIRGRRVLVLTIDPARRLANSLGVSEIGNEAVQIPLERFQEIGVEPEGELWAMMLDMKQSFDEIVRRHAPEDAREKILNNRIYELFSTSLAGTQEYAAAERLYELHEESDFDLIVLDTPPTTHALDFLEAPKRLEEAVKNKALQWLYKPGVLAGRKGLGIFSAGTSYVLKTLSKFTGTQLLDEMSTFLEHFSTLFDGLGERSRHVRDVLTSDVSTFVVVAAPDPMTIDEALYFHDKLGEEQVQVGGFVINRIHRDWVEPEDLQRPMVNLVSTVGSASATFEALDPRRLREFTERLVLNAKQFGVLAQMDDQAVERLGRETDPETPIRKIPFFARDIHSLSGLDMARKSLFSSDG